LAISAAETGHLVFATMNTVNAMRTLTRLIDSFPPEEQDVIRNMVSESLRGIVSQQLIPLKDSEGVMAAFEVLKVTPAVANLIRKNEMTQIESAMMTGKQDGMVLLDDSLKALVDQGLIDGAEAYLRAVNPRNFEQFAPRGQA
jgi:twitching motility protein PilT